MTQFDKHFILRNNQRFLGKSIEFRNALFEVAEGNAELYFGHFEIILNISEREIKIKDDIKIKSIDVYDNPHNHINCFGSWKQDIEKACKEHNILGIIYSILDYLKQVTFTDSGSSHLDRYCYIVSKENGEVIYNV